MENAISSVEKALNKIGLGNVAKASIVLSKARTYLEEKYPECKGKVFPKSIKDGTIKIGIIDNNHRQKIIAVSDEICKLCRVKRVMVVV